MKQITMDFETYEAEKDRYRIDGIGPGLFEACRILEKILKGKVAEQNICSYYKENKHWYEKFTSLAMEIKNEPIVRSE